MSLQGSIETFALPDVLGLLATTKKSGELRVVAGELEGSLWVIGGEMVQSVVGGRELTAVDATFALLRLTAGTFAFDADATAPKPGTAKSVATVLVAAQAALTEWREISKVVPDVHALVAMATEPPAPQITVAASQWKLLVALAGGRPVRDLMVHLATSEFDTCKAVKQLVDAGMATVVPGQAPKIGAKPLVAVDNNSHVAAGRAPAHQPRPVSGLQAARDARAGAETADETDQGADDEAAQHGRPGANGPRSARTAPVQDRNRRHPAAAAASDREKSEAATAADAQVLVAQLAALTNDDEEVVAEKVAAHLAEGGELPPVADANEPINRGLLLKFLSSVRN